MQKENFYELVEQYLDLDMIGEKSDSDETYNKSSFSLCESPFCHEDAISINDFVNNFLNIHADAKKLYHCGLKQLNCPYVIGVSNDFANKNPEYVKLGFLLIVIDANNNRGTYLNPIYLNQILYIEELREELKKNNSKEYIILKSRLDTNEKFYKILETQKKLQKIKLIRKYEGIGE